MIGISYKDLEKMLQRQKEIEETMRELATTQNVSWILERNINEVLKEEKSSLNKMIFDFAENSGATVYDICFNFVPRYSEPDYKNDNGTFTFEQYIKLVPLAIEFDKDPIYWKSKYNRLKERLQELINNND